MRATTAEDTEVRGAGLPWASVLAFATRWTSRERSASTPCTLYQYTHFRALMPRGNTQTVDFLPFFFKYLKSNVYHLQVEIDLINQYMGARIVAQWARLPSATSASNMSTSSHPGLLHF